MTSLFLYKTYIQPVLTYGIEIVQPKQSGKTWAIPKNYTQTDPFSSN